MNNSLFILKKKLLHSEGMLVTMVTSGSPSSFFKTSENICAEDKTIFS